MSLLVEMQKKAKKKRFLCEKAPNSGRRIRTDDLRVMSPTSYLTAPSRIKEKVAGEGFEPTTFGL